MQIKPDLSNVHPQDLDNTTIRNMNAIGVNFATLNTNRLRPFESRATKKRKWRNYFETDRASMNGRLKTAGVPKENIKDYDGSQGNAEKIKIL